MDFRYGVPITEGEKTLDRLERRLRKAQLCGDLAGATIIEGRITSVITRIIDSSRGSRRGLNAK